MCAFTHITLHPRIYHSHLPSSEQCRPYLRRLLLECFGDPILNLLIGREGEHQPPTSCAAHLGAEGSRGACDVDERVELGARDRQLLAERVVGVEELAERGPVGAIERLLARGDELRVLADERIPPRGVGFLLGLDVGHHLGGWGWGVGGEVEGGGGGE